MDDDLWVVTGNAVDFAVGEFFFGERALADNNEDFGVLSGEVL